MSVKPKKLSRMPFNPITCHGRPNSSSDGNAKARSVIPTRRINHDKIAISNCLPCFGQKNERSAVQDSIVLGKRKSAQKPLSLYNSLNLCVFTSLLARGVFLSEETNSPSIAATGHQDLLFSCLKADD